MQHPEITRILSTGYGEPVAAPIGVCKVCRGDVVPWETYGAGGGDLIHADCVNEEWLQLTLREKLDMLGFVVVSP